MRLLTPHRQSSWSVRGRVVCAGVTAALALLAGTACDGGGGGGPTRPPASVFGAVGGSLTRLAIEGYNELGGSRGWPDEELVEYGGGVIDLWAAQIGQPGRTWAIFESVLASEPGTDQIWWHILVHRRNGPPPAALSPADQQLVLEVAAEIERLAPGVPLFASPIPDYAPELAAACPQITETDERISALMVDFAVSRGLAERGPTLAPMTSANNNGPGDPCHQGPLGRQQHGRDLRAFFGG